jgi:alkanesulfonate monooxygenase SsuD/methylene tetrahydromethanopterin reductase-like flavin-dependent oxidoreductase (luciferase family)
LLGNGKVDEEEVSFSGRFYQLDRAPNRPRPLQEGTLPVLIAVSAACETDTLKLVARYADACGLMGDAAGVRDQLSALDGHMAELDRDPVKLSRIVLVPIGVPSTASSVERLTEDVASYRELGVDGLIVLLPVTWNEEIGSESLSGVDLVSSIGHSLKPN